jgi:sugar (pentulose or hexulose) kinase
MRTVASEEPGCRGAAILGSVAAGWYTTPAEAIAEMVRMKKMYEPNAAPNRVYAESFARYCELYERLATFF